MAWVIIESNLISVALWKQDGLYFMFDPKDTLADGKFTTKRLETIEKSIKEARMQARMESLRKTQVEIQPEPNLEMEVIDEELKKYAVPEAHLSMMHLPQSSYRLPMTNEDGKGKMWSF